MKWNDMFSRQEIDTLVRCERIVKYIKNERIILNMIIWKLNRTSRKETWFRWVSVRVSCTENRGGINVSKRNFIARDSFFTITSSTFPRSASQNRIGMNLKFKSISLSRSEFRLLLIATLPCYFCYSVNSNESPWQKQTRKIHIGINKII